MRPATTRSRTFYVSALLCACVAGVALLATPAFTQTDLVPEAATGDVPASERQVAAMIEQHGRNSLQTAEAYIGLADAQRRAHEYEAAAASYLQAVEAYRALDGPFTGLAIAPLTSLGDNYQEAEDYLKAVSAYSEARTVSRRVFGLHNEQQIELLDRTSQSLVYLNQLTEADEQQVEALRLVQRSHAPDSPEVLAAIYRYADWLGQRSLFQLQRDQYVRALRIIRQSYGDGDLQQITALVGIANTYRNERNPASSGLSSLQDAMALLLEQPERDPLAIATVLRDLGDWAVAFNKTGYAGTEYQRAWALLGEVENGTELRDKWFTGAIYVLYEPISPRSLSQEPDAPRGHVIASFDIDTQGNSNNVAIVESMPQGLKDEAVLRHIRRSRFRPLVANGELVRGEQLAIQFNFRYAQDDGEKNRG